MSVLPGHWLAIRPRSNQANEKLDAHELRFAQPALQLSQDSMKRAKNLEKWLEQDEAKSRPYRAVRLRTLLAALGPPEDSQIFFGGFSPFHTFVELKLAYIHGLYLASTLLALAIIEQEIAGSLHITGDDDAAKASLSSLLAIARKRSVITDGEYKAFNKLREVRNSYAHFRAPMDPTHVARRALAQETDLDGVLKSDATRGLKALTSFLNRRATGSRARRPTRVR
jgi:hypothetical protein